MSDPIFPDQHEPEKPTYYIANPVRVQLPEAMARAQGRRFTQLDLVALANNIILREDECVELRKMVRELSIRLSGLNTAVEALQANAARTNPYGVSSKLLAGLEAFADAMADDEPDEDPY